MIAPPGPNFIVPTPPAGDSSNRAASTEFVMTAIGAGGTFTTVNATTINATTVNATTVNATTLNVSGNAVITGTINGVTLDSNGWSTYVPTVGSGSGSFTSVSGAGRYKKIGRVVNLFIVVSIATNGTAGSFVTVTLPVNSMGSTFMGVGRMQSSVFNMTLGVLTSSSVLAITTMTGTFPGSDNQVLPISIVYESAS